MKKIINGKKYDTETATLMGEYSNNLGDSDFSHCTEMLYQKKTGEFFLYGEGGPRSKYAKQVGPHSIYGGEKIEPLTEDEAKCWAEEYLDGDEYEDIFGEVPQ